MNEIHQEEYVNDSAEKMGARNAKMTGKEKSVSKKFLTTEMITPEMREAGITEETELTTRKKMVKEYGEEMVASIEASALAGGLEAFESKA